MNKDSSVRFALQSGFVHNVEHVIHEKEGENENRHGCMV